MPNAFVYGSLLVDRVVHFVLARVPASVPAVLPHHSRSALRDRHYPGVVFKDGGVVCGKVLLGLTTDEVALLDEFEGDEYTRQTVRVLALPQEFYESHPHSAESEARAWLQRHSEASTGEGNEAAGIASAPSERVPHGGEWVQTAVYIYGQAEHALPKRWSLRKFLTEVDDFLEVERAGRAGEL